MDAWQMVLDFVAAGLWPAFAVTVVLLFKSDLGKLIGRIKSAAFAGASIEVSHAGDALERVGSSTDSSEAQVDEGAMEAPPDVDLVHMTRAELQDLVESFARAGWATGAEGGYSEPPRPVITWSGDGSPRLAEWIGQQRAGSRATKSANDLNRVRALENEIRKAEIAAGDPFGSMGIHERMRNAAELELLKKKLRRIDPDSAWA